MHQLINEVQSQASERMTLAQDSEVSGSVFKRMVFAFKMMV